MVVNLVEYLFDRAQREANDHLFEEAIDTCKEILRRTGGNPSLQARAHGFLGDLFLLLRDLPAAERHLSRALKCAPKNGEYHYLMGCTHTLASRWPEAIGHFETANKLMPNNAEVLRGLGWAVHCLGEVNKAENFLRRSVGIDPENVSAINDLAVCLMTQHRYEEAIALTEYALDLSPDDPLLAETYASVQQLRREYNRLMEEAERSRRSLGSRGYPSPVFARVEEIFDRSMRRAGYGTEHRENARRLWQDYLRKTRPQIRRPEVWAAAVEYAIASIDLTDSIDRTKLAARYKISATSLSRAYRSLAGILDLSGAGGRLYSARERSKSNHPSAQ